MYKTIQFLRVSTPNSAPMWGDPVTVFDSNGIPIPRIRGINLVEEKNKVFCMGRTWPNPFKPKTIKPFDLFYGTIALGVFDGECIGHDRYAKCILINNGDEVAALYPNPNRAFRHVMKEVFIHRPDSISWPGSAGCPTIEKQAVEDFFSLFRFGEKVKIHICGRI